MAAESNRAASETGSADWCGTSLQVPDASEVSPGLKSVGAMSIFLDVIIESLDRVTLFLVTVFLIEV